MPSIHDQLAWEEQMVQHGVERFRGQQDKAVDGDRTHETSAGSRLLRSYVIQISDRIKAYLDGKHPEGRRRGKYAKLLDAVDTDKAALLSLKAIIATLFNPISLQSLCVTVGKSIEDDLRFTRFHVENKEYYDEIIRNFERKGSENYRYKHRVLVNAEKISGLEWQAWTKEDHFGVGSMILSLLMEVCDLVEKQTVYKGHNRREVMVAPTSACIDWVLAHNESMELAHPDRMPCLIPPAEWTGLHHGGYYSPNVRGKTGFVKLRGSRVGRAQEDLLNAADLTPAMSAVNAMQGTGWQINDRVMQTMRDVWHANLGVGMPRSQPFEIPACPLDDKEKASEMKEDDPRVVSFMNWKNEAREIHTLERERVSKNLSLMRTFRMATSMEDFNAFYYVYQCDFRGRVYAATSGLSPQGTDHGKALIRFSSGKPLGESGLYWLKVHGANKYGFDKCDYDGRVAWVDERHEQLLAAAGDPIEHRAVWEDADKPYQFLAFCFEYADAAKEGTAFVSHLPIALDGSCNGLQHFSAMLRDEVGGRAVNLVPADRPNDIYQDVADVCTRKLRGLRSMVDERHGGAANWLALFQSLGNEPMPRKLSKTPVMTLPYGSTQQACTETIFRWQHENSPDFFEKSTGFRHALYLSPILWSSISEVVVAARVAMDWVQKCTGVLAKAGHPIQYTSPLGFPVYQASYRYKTRCIETQISGRLQLRFAEDTDKLDSRKQRQGSSPNLVHHVDATHMLMCLNSGVDAGLSSFAMIHDDFATHACDTPVWHGIIREQFVKLHTETDVLAEFKRVHEERHGIDLPDLPAKGTLDITEVLKSPYFFG